MVAGWIQVRKGDFRTDGNYQHEGVELHVLLRHAVLARGSRVSRAAVRPESDNGIADRAALLIDNVHREWRCGYLHGGAKQQGPDERSSRHALAYTRAR